jgi:hypothetical protein
MKLIPQVEAEFDVLADPNYGVDQDHIRKLE